METLKGIYLKVKLSRPRWIYFSIQSDLYKKGLIPVLFKLWYKLREERVLPKSTNKFSISLISKIHKSTTEQKFTVSLMKMNMKTFSMLNIYLYEMFLCK